MFSSIQIQSYVQTTSHLGEILHSLILSSFVQKPFKTRTLRETMLERGGLLPAWSFQQEGRVPSFSYGPSCQKEWTLSQCMMGYIQMHNNTAPSAGSITYATENITFLHITYVVKKINKVIICEK